MVQERKRFSLIHFTAALMITSAGLALLPDINSYQDWIAVTLGFAAPVAWIAGAWEFNNKQQKRTY